MVRGKSIRIFLSDGSVTGIRHAEVVNWTGQALYCPRNKASELAEWDEVNRPGIYFLLGEDVETLEPKVYIGEAENVLKRLHDHINNKEFWTEVIFFTNKDENLTKGHIKYLESRIIEVTSTLKRYVLDNNITPQLPALPRGDRDSMEDFIDHIRLLLGTLGHKLLEPLLNHTKIQPTSELDTLKDEKNNHTEKLSISDTKLYLKIGEITASGVLTNEGLVVLAGSLASCTDRDSLPHFWRELKNKLVSQKTLIPIESNFEFSENYLFKSPSAAGNIISGYSINGRECWKDKSGKTINELEILSTN